MRKTPQERLEALVEEHVGRGASVELGKLSHNAGWYGKIWRANGTELVATWQLGLPPKPGKADVIDALHNYVVFDVAGAA